MTMQTLSDPKTARAFRFVDARRDGQTIALRYAFDDGPLLTEKLTFLDAPAEIPAGREVAFDRALQLLHSLCGISYYKAGVPSALVFDGGAPDSQLAALLEQTYLHGLAEFAHHNQLDLRDRLNFPRAGTAPAAPELGLRDQALVPIGGGKDSLVSIEAIKKAGIGATVAWVGNSELIATCAAATGLPTLQVQRQLAPELFELNRRGAYNGHLPITAINSAILVVAAIWYDFNAVVFSNEASADAPTLSSQTLDVNHQWSKGVVFERLFADYVHQVIAADLHYLSLLRPYSELAITRRFAELSGYDHVFSSCNRNFRIVGPRPESRWCGRCPKCQFVFLGLAPFMPKPRLLAIFGRNLLDDIGAVDGFDALIEWQGQHKPFECVGEAVESRVAFAALCARADWQEDALVARFKREILPQLNLPTLDAMLTARGALANPKFSGVVDAT